MRLNDRSIRSIRGTGAPQYIRDPKTPMLRLFVNASGTTKTWSLRYRLDPTGKQSTIKLGRFPDLGVVEARKRARAARQRIADGGTPAPAPTAARVAATGLTFGTLADQYLAERVPELAAETATAHRRRIAKHLRPAWGDRLVAEIRFRDVREVTQPIVATAPIEARRLHQLIGAIFAWGVRMDLDGLDVNPCAGRPLPGKNEVARERVLSNAELRRLVAVCQRAGHDERVPAHRLNIEDAAILVILEVLLGQRGREFQTMRWSDVDCEAEGGVIWTIPRDSTKARRTHRVPLSDHAAAILVARGLETPAARRHSVFVFPNPAGDGPIARPIKALRRLFREARLVGVRRHDLRRTCATRLGALGYSDDLIGRVLNHAGLVGHRTTLIYNRHSYDAEKRAALQAWADALDTVIGVDRIQQQQIRRAS